MRSLLFVATLALTACSPVTLDDVAGEAESEANATLVFSPSTDDVTRAAPADCFTRLNVMLFAPDGSRAFAQVKTQSSGDEGFGRMALTLDPGRYTVVAVGHSSGRSTTIKSPQAVQFTAQDGRKLTDTFCCAETIEVGEDAGRYNLTLRRATAAVHFAFTDTPPESVARWRVDYTGGSANVNPTTMEGYTRSTQSEVRAAGESLTFYTFPYMAASSTLKMTVTALAADGAEVHKRTFEGVPVSRNRITTYRGAFFLDDGDIRQEGLTFTVESAWAGEDVYDF